MYIKLDVSLSMPHYVVWDADNRKDVKLRRNYRATFCEADEVSYNLFFGLTKAEARILAMSGNECMFNIDDLDGVLDDGKVDMLILELHGYKGSKFESLVYRMALLEAIVYIMNGNGKTIDKVKIQNTYRD